MTENRRRREEAGFTLIELLVVMLVIGILMSVAVLTYLRVSNGAGTKAAWSNIRTALSAARVVATETTYEAVDVNALQQVEPSINWSPAEDAPSTGVQTISWATPGGEVMHLAVQAKNGDCYYLTDDLSVSGGLQYAKDVASDLPPDGCKASNVPQSQPYAASLDQGWVG